MTIFRFRRKSVREELENCVKELERCLMWVEAWQRSLRSRHARMVILAGLPPFLISNTFYNAAISTLVKIRKKLLKLSSKIGGDIAGMILSIAVEIPDEDELRRLSYQHLRKVVLNTRVKIYEVISLVSE